MAIVFGKTIESSCSKRCLPEAPKYEEVCCKDICNPCEVKKCPPVTCASDAIKIEAGEVERCFTLRQMGCNGRPIPAIRTCVRMDVRRKGLCEVLLKIKPYRASHNNGICFTWGEHFNRLPSGYYECDIYINDECCTHILLYKQACSFVATSDENVVDDGCNECVSCGSRNCRSRCCSVPQYDESIEETIDTCNTECNSC